MCQRLRCNKTRLVQAAQKDPEARRARTVIVSVNVAVESTNTNTLTERIASEAIERQRSLWVFFSGLLATKEFVQ